MTRKSKKRDNGLDSLLILDGETFGMNTHGCWVKFEAHEVDVTESVPHGISYSLTLHSKDGKRIFGMDNAHAAEDGRNNYKARVVVFDHLHPEGKKNSRPYKFESVDKLISDFWRRVDKRIKELYE